MKTFAIAAALTAASAPVSSSFDTTAAAVPLPPAVTAVHLHSAPSAPVPAAEPAGRDHAVIDRIVEFQGRELALCLVRSGSAGMAVLSVPEDSAVPSLPDIAEADFRGLVTGASGCRLEGDIREVASSRGTIAISTGLDCSGAGS
ncbi:hypothetical protein [Leisingera caerulea]|uniref:hypothetical protein n=1 Tax=Leisingera caerulea TaxID=506591 RepID=UPI000421013F|nr:hypothetical protein [Leisingera caerulea]